VYSIFTVVDEPVGLCVTPLRYAQIHGFSRWSSIYRRRTFRISSCGKYLLSRRVSQTILMARSDRPSGCRWPAIRRVALQPTTDGRTVILSRYTELEVDQAILLQRLKITLPAQSPPRILVPDVPSSV
jgi:hypothetical protein